MNILTPALQLVTGIGLVFFFAKLAPNIENYDIFQIETMTMILFLFLLPNFAKL